MKNKKQYTIEQTAKMLDAIYTKEVDLDFKLYCILNLLWDEKIGITTALELCEVTGIFKSSYLEISLKKIINW